MTRQYHEVSNIFPLMEGAEFEELVNDIERSGLRVPIFVAPDGSIIDGRNRYRALVELGLEDDPEYYVEFDEEFDGSVINFVLSMNLRRRQLTKSQAAAAAALALPYYSAQARERQGTRTDVECNEENIVEKIPPSETGKARDFAAEAFDVNPRYVSDAAAIQEKAPEVFDEVMAGSKSLAKAKREVLKKHHLASETGEVEWYTPPKIVELVRLTMGSIDLDPCTAPAAQEIVQADKFYTVADDGLAQDWAGTVYVNPPYARGVIDEWAVKITDAAASDEVTAVIALVNNATATKWWQSLAANAALISFPQRRLKFVKADGSNGDTGLQGQTIFLFTDDRQTKTRFRKAFSQLGIVLK